MVFFVFCNNPATTNIYTYLHTLSLHDALPIYGTGSETGTERDFSGSAGPARRINTAKADLRPLSGYDRPHQHAATSPSGAQPRDEYRRIARDRAPAPGSRHEDRKSTRLNSSH